jgi:hypothetical protein
VHTIELPQDSISVTIRREFYLLKKASRLYDYSSKVITSIAQPCFAQNRLSDFLRRSDADNVLDERISLEAVGCPGSQRIDGYLVGSGEVETRPKFTENLELSRWSIFFQFIRQKKSGADRCRVEDIESYGMQGAASILSEENL